MSHREVHVELLLGRKVADVDGRVVGRLEEFVAGDVNGEAVVMEYHVGPEALLERLSATAMQLPFFRLLKRWHPKLYRVRWDQMDLSDPERPRLNCRREHVQSR